MPELQVCSRCGAALGPEADGPICPACLFEAALAQVDTVTERPVRDALKVRPAPQPERVGPYQILSLLGEGGMGVVYLAEQAAPIRRRVALKLIRLGMDTRQVVARFDAERQALALMDHQNIASVFDAGATDDGRPYFVMEYVPGVPITDFSDRHQLSTRARLELFQQVCAAVQHAHQKGVIHRDLKPSNVLVMEQDGRPMPKIIDFGIAKATDQHLTGLTLFTAHGVLIGTPEYMSPEQADTTTGDVDTRADIYSLGMILYELLVGSLPFAPRRLRQGGYAEIQRIIREEEPPKPSTKLGSLGDAASDVATRRRTNTTSLARDLRGDLDWITLKAIEKDRSRRYASASEFASDIGRHLHHEPVAAGPPRASYRLRKFVRKHRAAVAAWAALLLMLTAGLAVSATLYVRAERARQDANRQRVVADNERLAALTASGEANQQRQVAQAERAAAETQRRAAEEKRDEALYQTYRSALLAADLSLQTGDVAQARQQLQATDPRLRGWEWRYLARAADSSLAATPAFALDVRSVSFTRSGDAVLARGYHVFQGSGRGVKGGSPGRPPEVSVTRVTTAATVSRLDLGGRVVTISPDGTRALSAGWHLVDYPPVCERQEDSPGFAVCQPGPGYWPSRAAPSPEDRERLVVRDTTTGRVVATLRHPNLGVWRSTQLPPGPLVLSTPVRPGVTSVTLSGSREPLAMLSGENIDAFGATFSADGTRVATWSWDNIIYVWDVAAQAILSTLRGHRDGIRSVAFNSTATEIVSTSFDDMIRLWTVSTGEESRTWAGPGAATAVYSPNGAIVAVGHDSGRIRILDVPTGRLVHGLAAHTTPINSLAFAPDSIRLASSARTDRRALLWDVSTGAQLLSFVGHQNGVSGVAFRPDGNIVATGSQDGTVRLWNARAALSTLTGHTDGVWVLAFANGAGDVLSASTDASVRLWEATSGRFKRLELDRGGRATLFPYIGLSGHPPRVAVPSRASAGPDGVRRQNSTIIDIASGTAVMQVAHEELGGMAISPDGRRLGVAGRTGTGGVIRLWRIPSARPAGAWTLAGVWPTGAQVAFSHDGRRLAVTADARSPSDPQTPRGRVLILEEGSSSPVAAITVPFAPNRPVFLPDGSGVLYTNGPSVQIWKFQSGSPAATLPGHDGISVRIAVTPDGSRIVTGSNDGSLRIWDAARAELLLTVRLGSWVTALAVSPDGDRIAAGLSDGRIQILDASAVAGPGKGQR